MIPTFRPRYGPRLHPPAYLLTFTTYGTWLRGDARGWTPLGGAHRGRDELRELLDFRRMNGEPLRLILAQRRCCLEAILETCRYRGWTPHAVHVRTNHVHVVVGAGDSAERVLGDLKAWATRRLRDRGLVKSDAPVWTRSGSLRALWDERAILAACRYVNERQGADIGSAVSGGDEVGWAVESDWQPEEIFGEPSSAVGPGNRAAWGSRGEVDRGTDHTISHEIG